ncbi:MAG: hypothetical protein MH472_09200 [Bacteroidia bacterium]|nr:hypothetical protein [Bacteroidia bacterium]
MLETQSISSIKKELSHLSAPQLSGIILRLSKFKKINKELTHYLLFEAHDEDSYVEKVKNIIDTRFKDTPKNSSYLATKQIRKTLRLTNQYAGYSDLVQTEIELLIYFCQQTKPFVSLYKNQTVLSNLYLRQFQKIDKLISKLHEDLQYDYRRIMKYEL